MSHAPPRVHQQVHTHDRPTQHLVNTLTTHSSSHITRLQPHATLMRQIHQLHTQTIHTHTTQAPIHTHTHTLAHANGSHGAR